ncbi:MAG: hypothetical protein ABI970_20910, partial [Chloroflexota bacterium]
QTRLICVLTPSFTGDLRLSAAQGSRESWGRGFRFSFSFPYNHVDVGAQQCCALVLKPSLLLQGLGGMRL